MKCLEETGHRKTSMINGDMLRSSWSRLKGFTRHGGMPWSTEIDKTPAGFATDSPASDCRDANVVLSELQSVHNAFGQEA